MPRPYLSLAQLCHTLRLRCLLLQRSRKRSVLLWNVSSRHLLPEALHASGVFFLLDDRVFCQLQRQAELFALGGRGWVNLRRLRLQGQ